MRKNTSRTIKTEKHLWQKLKREIWPGIIFKRIETSTVNGVPDVFFTAGKINGWIELKVILAVDRYALFDKKLLHLSTNQIRWLQNIPNSYVLLAVTLTDINKVTEQNFLCLSIEQIMLTHNTYDWGSVCSTIGVTSPYLINFSRKLRGIV